MPFAQDNEPRQVADEAGRDEPDRFTTKGGEDHEDD